MNLVQFLEAIAKLQHVSADDRDRARHLASLMNDADRGSLWVKLQETEENLKHLKEEGLPMLAKAESVLSEFEKKANRMQKRQDEASEQSHVDVEKIIPA